MKRIFFALFLMTVMVVVPSYSYAQRGMRLPKPPKPPIKIGTFVKPIAKPPIIKPGSTMAAKSKSEIISRVATIGGIRIANQLQPNGNIVDYDGQKLLLKPCFSCNSHGYIYLQGYYYLCNSCKGYGFLIYPYIVN